MSGTAHPAIVEILVRVGMLLEGGVVDEHGMGTDSLIGGLAILTLLLAIGFGIWQYLKVQRSKRKHTSTTIGDVDSHRTQTAASNTSKPDRSS